MHYSTTKIIKKKHVFSTPMFESEDKLVQIQLKYKNSILLVNVFCK